MVLQEKKNKGIVYDKETFNPLFFVIQKLLKMGVIEFYIFGGKSSAKTVSIAQTIAKLVFEKKENAIFFRKEGSTVKRTLKRSLVKSLESTRFKRSQKKLSRKFKTQEWTLKSVRGKGEIHLTGLDSPDKVKGIEGYNWMYLDEINQFTIEDYYEATGAFRGEIVRAFFGSWNPVDINSWIKTKVVDTEDWQEVEGVKLPSPASFVKISLNKKKALIKTVYTDNYFMVGSPCGTYGYVDQDTIDKYERMKAIDEHWYNVNVLAEWGVIKPENPFFARFVREKHLRKGLQYDKRLPVALSFDFNVRNSCLAGQFNFYDRTVRILKEWRLVGQDLPELLNEVIRYFGKDKEYIITGDSSGNSGSALTQGNIGAWDIIRKFLDGAGVQYDMSNIPASNMRHINSRMVNNAILFMEEDYFIDEDECPELISDIERMQTSKDGGLDKKDADKKNYGHLGDCFRYFNDTLLTDFYESYDIVKWYDD